METVQSFEFCCSVIATCSPPQLEELAQRLIEHEVSTTSDPNTIFRGNSLASKVIDEFMKLVGQSYLQKTLGCCIDEV